MEAHYLSPYLIMAKSGRRAYELDDIRNIDLFYELIETLSELYELDKVYEFEDFNRGLKVKSIQYDEEERVVYGQVEVGAYGKEAPIVDKDTGEETYHKTVQEMEMVPYYYLFYIPVGHAKGIALIERIGQKGIKTYLHNLIVDKIAKPNEFSLYINPMVLKEVIDEIFRNDLVRIRLVKHAIPRDVADELHVSENEAYKEEHIIAKRDKKFYMPELIKRLQEKLFSDEDIRFYEVLPIEGTENVDDIKLEFKIGRSRRRTVSIRGIHTLRSDVFLDDLEVGEDGHPIFRDIHYRALEVLQTIKEVVYDISAEA